MKNQLNQLRNLGALLLATAALTTSALAGPDTQAFLQRTYVTTPDKKQVVPVQRPKVTKFTANPKALASADLRPTLLTAGDGTVTVWRN